MQIKTDNELQSYSITRDAAPPKLYLAQKIWQRKWGKQMAR